MDFQDVIRRRRMIRNYETRAVPASSIERIVQNALHAPSAGFSQGWAFLVLTEETDRAKFWDTEWDDAYTGQYEGVRRAPVVIVPMSNKEVYLDRYAEPDKGWTDRSEEYWPVPFWHIDTGFASMIMLLTAVDEGLGALFFGVRRKQEFRDAFGVPADYEPIGAIAIGYSAPDELSPSLKRGRKTDVIHYGKFNSIAQGPG